MKREMTLLELQDIMGKRIRVCLDETLTPDERHNENAQTAMILGLAKQMINNADIVLRTETLKAKGKDSVISRMDNIIGDDEK